MHRIAQAIAIVLLTAATALAQTRSTAPSATTTSTTRRAPTTDQSTPKAALRKLFAQSANPDEATLRSLLHASNPAEQAILDATVRTAVALAHLRDVEVNKFGKDHAPTSLPMTLDTGSLAEVESFVEKIDGDQATVTSPAAPENALRFVKIDGQWKLAIASVAQRMDESMVQAVNRAAAMQVKLLGELANDVESGKLRSDDDVKQQFKKRTADRIKAASQPAATTARS